MAPTRPPSLSPRKKPRQARSEATVDAIFEATLQLLVADGIRRLTTTRVAERAGVSVGTMYQYFPNKNALVYALNERYLTRLADRIEAECFKHRGTGIDSMVEMLIQTYWSAKMERIEVTRALYRSVVELDNQVMIDTFAAKVDAATTAMLASACDVSFDDVEAVNLTLVTAIFGTVRNAFERDLDIEVVRKLQSHVVTMCRAYIRRVALTSAAPS